MKKLVGVIAIFMVLSNLSAQQDDFNVNLISNVPFPEGCNDIWGYVDEEGVEYAIIGTRTATVVLSLEDPANPIQRYRKEGGSSTWRDVKTYKNYAYISNDASDDGILIIDMSGAPNNITGEYNHIPFNFNGQQVINQCHNVYIDTDKGILFLSGCNSGSSGVLMFDLTKDPENPEFIGAESRFYSHDNFARNDTLWSSDLTQGFSVWDISDPASPQELGRKLTTSVFAHNGWLSDDGNYFFTTDERGNAYLDAYDVTDMNDIQLLDAYRSKATEGRGVIPHNTHYYNGYLVTSWYTDGLKIVDGSRPHNLIEVASYDTWTGADGGFNGCWGAYPYLPSGLILLSDIQRGLFVLGADYVKGCYLEGTVTNNLDFLPVSDVQVEIVSDYENLEATQTDGMYATGQAESGTFDVKFSHPDYQDTVLSVDLMNGVVTKLDVELRAKPFYRVKINVIDANTLSPVPNASIQFSNEFRTENVIADINGETETVIFQDQSNTYQIHAGKWGYLHNTIVDADLDSGVEYTIELEEGYQDDFIFDQGWTVDGDAPRGIWVRADPIGTTVGGEVANPIDDIDTDLGMQCFVTGNINGNAGQEDVDDGVTRLTSPEFDLSRYTESEISFRTWFFNGSRPNPNDSLRVMLTNGKDQVTLLVIEGFESSSVWSDSFKVDVKEVIAPTATMQLIVEASDDAREGHIVEGGFDEFRVSWKISTADENTAENHIVIAPTIIQDMVKITGLDEAKEHQINVINTEGKTVIMKKSQNFTSVLSLGALNSGNYIIQITNEEGLRTSQKVTKL